MSIGIMSSSVGCCRNPDEWQKRQCTKGYCQHHCHYRDGAFRSLIAVADLQSPTGKPAGGRRG
jgi:hypothetical protein